MFTYKPLLKMLIEHNIKKTQLISLCGIANTTITKISQDKYIEMQSLDKICNYFKCQLTDIVEHIPDNK